MPPGPAHPAPARSDSLFAEIAALESGVEQGWEAQYPRALLAALREPWRSSVLPTLRARLLSGEHPRQGYEERLRQSMQLLHELYFALHSGASFEPENPKDSKRPRGFWTHQRFSVFQLGDETRGIAPSKPALERAAAHYLDQPLLRTSKLDWVFLDAMVFIELETFAQQCFVTRAGVGTNWAAVFAPREERKYYALSGLLWLARGGVLLGIPLAAAYGLLQHRSPVLSGSVLAISVLYLLGRLVTHPRRRQIRRKNRVRLDHLSRLYALLAEPTISPRRLRAALEAATADGVVLDETIFAIVDRAMARDPTALIPSQVG